jgi:hypothetical protein
MVQNLTHVPAFFCVKKHKQKNIEIHLTTHIHDPFSSPQTAVRRRPARRNSNKRRSTCRRTSRRWCLDPRISFPCRYHFCSITLHRTNTPYVGRKHKTMLHILNEHNMLPRNIQQKQTAMLWIKAGS